MCGQGLRFQHKLFLFLILVTLTSLMIMHGCFYPRKHKLILFWLAEEDLADFQHTIFEHFGLGHKPFTECQVSDCSATIDKTLASQAGAVIFHMIHINSSSKLPVATERSPRQRYVFYMREPPFQYGYDLRKFNSYFNLTMTYRLDSDIPHQYGRFTKRSERVWFNSTWPAAQKQKLVAWFVSRCTTRSRREELAEELQKYIPVDIFGKCGTLSCDKRDARGKRNFNCYTMVEENYKFYLSFENSLCTDYVTEKLFKLLRVRAVPVVYGLADYEKVAPPHSYINALDFSSPKHLAEYLLMLDKNDTLYREYFAWKEMYMVKGPRDRDTSFCKLCELVNDPTLPPKVYWDIGQWWGDADNCDNHLMQKLKASWSKELSQSNQTQVIET